MALNVGSRLGHYEVTAKIGEGGMGEVHRARDTKLDRDVALKVLPQAFTDDPDRLARFEREAKVLASLNHPNIGHIYRLEEAAGQKAWAMMSAGSRYLWCLRAGCSSRYFDTLGSQPDNTCGPVGIRAPTQ